MSEPLDALLAAEIAAATQAAAGAPPVDLRTLLAELVALKAEIRQETRAARELRAEVEAQRAKNDPTRSAARALIDVADRLDASILAARAPAPRRWFRRGADARILALAEGLALTRRRIREDLGTLGVTPIRTVGLPFDPELMEARQVSHDANQAEGVVLAEITTGWRDASGVLRAAEVIVNREPTHD